MISANHTATYTGAVSHVTLFHFNFELDLDVSLLMRDGGRMLLTGMCASAIALMLILYPH